MSPGPIQLDQATALTLMLGPNGSVGIQAREVLGILKRFGFEVVATRGSHAKLRREIGGVETQTLTVPLHKELDLGTIRAIYRQAARFIPEEDLRPLFYSE